MSSVTGKAFDIKLFRRVLSYARPYRLMFVFSLFLTILGGALLMIRIFYIGQMVSVFVKYNDKEGLANLAVILVGLICLEAVIQFSITNMSNIVGQNVIRDVRVELFRKICSLRLKYFDQNPIGRLVTRAVSDIETIADVFSQGILTISSDLLKLVLVVTLMLVYDWRLGLAALAPIPILIWATVVFKKVIKAAFSSVRTEVANLNTFTQEHITGMKIVQIFNREEKEAETFRLINEKHKKAHIKSVWAFSVFLPSVEILSAASLGLVIVCSSLLLKTEVIDGAELAGTITMYIMLISNLYRPIRMLADRFNVLQMGMVGSERVFKVLDTEEYVQDKGLIHIAEFNGEIEFKDVDFSYNVPEKVLKGVSFKVEQGETVAFVGATGAGKTSIINLISRFYEFQNGTILIDGADIRNYAKETIRTNVALVLQDVFLFSDTIHNNITLGDRSITRSKVVAAAKYVGAHDFIMNLPDNYDFNVRERGGVLSVGQRQLISFIRAYVYQPRILVLDEATSSIDTESEFLIQRAIKKLTQDRTALIIAHRLSTIYNSDRIIVLDNGQVVEEGNHTELLKIEQGYYKRLHDLQFME
ncbi:MAG: ABC transporter ATP-binding protein [Flavobacteriales bacterium]|nr:ABC transporter ATP-binding protein [Flavobacteriales bacterium]